MPIRPEDFDVDTSPRPVVRKPDVDKRTSDKHSRAQQERESSALRGGTNGRFNRHTLVWVIAPILAALVLFGLRNPFITTVRKVLNKASTPIVTPRPTTDIHQPPLEPPAATVAKPSDRSPEKPAETSSTAQSGPETVTKSALPVRRPTRERRSPENSDTQTLKESLERQQAELEKERKRLADAQLALDDQKRREGAEAERAREQAKQQELDAQQRERRLKDSLRAETKAEKTSSERPAAPYLGPRSGTLEWNGEVESGDFIDIADGRSNRGNLSGELLPGVPVMVTVSPSNLTISSPPGPSNQWKRIVLYVRAKGSKKITVKVHWALP